MTEQDVQRFLTKQFININPTTISLTPVTMVKNSKGAMVRQEQVPRVEQVFRLIPLESPPVTAPIVNDDGKHRNHDAVLLGEYDSLMAVGDIWTDHEGFYYEIIEIAPSTPLNYQRKGLVLKRGKNINVSDLD